MKSQLRTMLKIWRAASYDATLACALPFSESDLDMRTLERIALTRGEGVFLFDLPSLDEHLLFILEHGYSHFQGPLTARKSKKDLRPKFLWGYWSLVIDEKGVLKSDASPDAILAIRQLTKGLSKLEVECTKARLEESIRDFYAIEDSIALVNASWQEDEFKVDPRASLVFYTDHLSLDQPIKDDRERLVSFRAFAQRFDRIAGILVSGLGSFDSMSEDSVDTGFFKHGPGAVSNLTGRGYKYLFPFWSEKLEGVFPFDWCSGSPLGASPRSAVEKPGRLLAVPKTAKGPRLIASEPLEHQWCQQKIATWLSVRYERSRVGRFIALRDQSLSQRLVASASLDRSLSTIDLSSASDRISTWHIEALFRSNPGVLHAMHAVRTRRLEDGVTFTGIKDIRKFTTMGSALTFPVQSLFFLTIALASCGANSARDIDRLGGKVRVFGDDIIVPDNAYANLVEHINLLGLKVNVKKSFHDGSFRESCGADYWDGWNVTPVKPKTIKPDTAESVQAILDSSNNAHMRGYWRTAEALARLLPKSIREGCVTRVDSSNSFLTNSRVQQTESVVPALHTFGEEYFPDKRWNVDLHRWDIRIVTLKRVTKQEKQDNSAALREFFTRPFRWLYPRETGATRKRAANLAVRWVGSPKGSWDAPAASC